MTECAPVPIERCQRCGGTKTMHEVVYLTFCEQCEEDIELEKKRPSLYEMLGLKVPFCGTD